MLEKGKSVLISSCLYVRCPLQVDAQLHIPPIIGTWIALHIHLRLSKSDLNYLHILNARNHAPQTQQGWPEVLTPAGIV